MSNSTLTEEEIFNGPSGPPPEGVVPIFDNPPNMTTGSYVVTTLCMAITTVMVAIRIYAKAYCLKDVRIPDVLGVIAYGIYVGFVYAMYDCFHDAGFLIDIWNYQLKNLPLYLYPNYIITILYPLVLLFLKSALLLEWCRIFVPLGTRNLFWWMSYILVALNVSFYLAMFFGWAFSCSPVEVFWKPWIPGTCVNMLVLDLINGAFNLLTDLALLILPQHVIWKLNISIKKRVGVSVIFAIGLTACAIAAARIPYAARMYLSNSLTYDLSALDLWNLGEMTCGFIVFCVPASIVVFAKIQSSTILSALKSWLSSISSKLGSSKDKSEPSTLAESNSRRDYHQLNKPSAEGQGSNDLDINSASHSHELEQFRSADEAAILRTVNFTASEDYGDHHTADEQYGRQYPWTHKPQEPQPHV